MDNFYIAFFTYLTLIFIASKLWGVLHWPWWIVVSPMVVMTIVGAAANLHGWMHKKSDRAEAIKRIQDIIDKGGRN